MYNISAFGGPLTALNNTAGSAGSPIDIIYSRRLYTIYGYMTCSRHAFIIYVSIGCHVYWPVNT